MLTIGVRSGRCGLAGLKLVSGELSGRFTRNCMI
jgi:hypothetical protein